MSNEFQLCTKVRGGKRKLSFQRGKSGEVCGIYCREFLLGEGEARLAYIYQLQEVELQLFSWPQQSCVLGKFQEEEGAERRLKRIFPVARLMLAGRGITARLVPWSERRLIIFFAPTNLRALSLSFFFSLFRKYAHSSSLWSLCDQGYSLSFLSFPFLLPYLRRILFQVGLYIIS